MLKTVATWEARRLYRMTGRSLIALVAFPCLFFVPWQRLGLFENSFQAALLLTSIYAFMASSNIASESGEFSRTAFWLFQKGASLAEYQLARYAILCAYGFGFLVLGAGAASLAMMAYHSFQLRYAAVLTLVSILLYLVTSALYFVMGAAMLRRKSEFLVLLVLVAATQGLLLSRASAHARSAAHALLPPIEDIYSAPSALINGDWLTGLREMLHLSLFVAACLAVAYVLHEHWKPDRARVE